eukprot:8879015-Karenia_brevis.AAC.1
MVRDPRKWMLRNSLAKDRSLIWMTPKRACFLFVIFATMSEIRNISTIRKENGWTSQTATYV